MANAGWQIARYGTVDSTQRVAAALIARGAAHRTAIVAERQTAGYGRKGDRWLDTPGNTLLATLILRPMRADMTPRYAMAGALAVCDAIAALTAARTAIKWPNDVLLGGCKCAGVLGDAVWHGGRLDALRIGIGVNLRGSRAAFADRGLPGATSIAAETGIDPDRDAFLAALLCCVGRYDDALADGDASCLVAGWRAASDTVGRTVAVTLRDGSAVQGSATALTDDGDLLILMADGGMRRISAPEVQSLRPSP